LLLQYVVSRIARTLNIVIFACISLVQCFYCSLRISNTVSAIALSIADDLHGVQFVCVMYRSGYCGTCQQQHSKLQQAVRSKITSSELCYKALYRYARKRYLQHVVDSTHAFDTRHTIATTCSYVYTRVQLVYLAFCELAMSIAHVPATRIRKYAE
jgi:hypothetical protein